MGTKKIDHDDGTQATDSLQGFFSAAGADNGDDGGEPAGAGDAGSDAQGQQGGGDDGSDDRYIEPQYDPDHPLYIDPEAGDDAGGDEPDKGDQPKPNAKPAGDIPDKENPERFQYWQSVATKQQEQLDRLTAMMEKNMGGGSAPANGNQADDDPEPDPAQVIQQKETELRSLTAPEKPTKPENYNSTDAYTDPDSVSFKHRVAMDEWNSDFADYSMKRQQLQDEVYNAKLKSLEEPVSEIKRERQLTNRDKKMVATLKENYKFDDQQALDFIQQMSKPESMSLDNLVKYYRITQGVESPNAKKSTDKKQENRSRKREAAPPIPNGSDAGFSVDYDIDEEELQQGRQFGSGLLNFNR